MHILLITQYFPPETGATSNRLLSLAKGIQAAGHEVVVVAEKPNHPEGVIRPGYEEGFFTEREYEGIPVIYTWVYTQPGKNFVGRMLFYLSFMAMAVPGALRAKGRFDVVLASSPPLFVGLAGWMAAKLKGARFVFDVRDLWPDVAVAMGMLDRPVAVRVARAIERFIYKRADGITAVTDSFCRHIASITGADKPIARVMNGTEPALFQQDAERATIRAALGLEESFVVGYVGNLGLAQGLEHVLDAAVLFPLPNPLPEGEGTTREVRLNDSAPNVHFLILGSGPMREALMQGAGRRGLTNVTFLPRMNLKEAAAHMAASDALLVPLASHPIYRQFIPSKLFDSMAAGKPVLLSVDGEARAILEEADAGLYYAAEDGEALAECIRRLRDQPKEADAIGKRGRNYATEHCARAVQVGKLVGFLEELRNAKP